MKELITREDGFPLSEREEALNQRFLELKETNEDWYSDSNKKYVHDYILSMGISECESYWNVIKKHLYDNFSKHFAGNSTFEIEVHNFRNVFPNCDARTEVFKIMKEKTVNPLKYLFEKVDKLESTTHIEKLLNCLYFDMPGRNYHEREEWRNKLNSLLKKYLIGTAKLWHNMFLGINENIKVPTPLLISHTDSDVKYFHQNLLDKYLFRYVDTSYYLHDIDKKLYTNLLIGVPEVEKLNSSQQFQLWYYSCLNEIEYCEQLYPIGEEQQRCASLVLYGNEISRGLSQFMGSYIVPFYVSDFNVFEFIDIDKESLWAEIINQYLSGAEWKLDDKDREFIQSYLTELTNQHKNLRKWQEIK